MIACGSPSESRATRSSDSSQPSEHSQSYSQPRSVQRPTPRLDGTGTADGDAPDPVPERLIERVSAPACAMKSTVGDHLVPAEWCAPIQACSPPSITAASRVALQEVVRSGRGAVERRHEDAEPHLFTGRPPGVLVDGRNRGHDPVMMPCGPARRARSAPPAVRRRRGRPSRTTARSPVGHRQAY